MADQKTLRELAAPDINYNSLCIKYPNVVVAFELKSGLIHLLPKFSGLSGEDPHRHLKEFQVVCSTPLRPEGITEDHIKLRTFPFSLQGAAKDWLYYLQPNTVASWTDLKKLFLEKYFPASRAASIRKEICGIRQCDSESLFEYWERFKQLVSSCPQHQISEQLLIQYFYEGLLPMDRNILDAASGGALVDKTPAAAKALIENMSLNSQQFTTRSNSVVLTKGVNEIQASPPNKAIEIRLDELTSLVKQLALGKTRAAERVCGICTSPEHPTDICPILQDESITELPQAYAVNVYNQGNNQNRYNAPDLSTNRYHPNWRNHPNLQYATSGSSLEDIVKQLAAQIQTTNASMNDLKTLVGQLVTTMNQMQTQSSRNLPDQTVPNPNVSAITLRSGKEVDAAVEASVDNSGEKNDKNNKNKSTPTPAPTPTPELDEDEEQSIPLPFPQRAVKSKREHQFDMDREILDVFKKVEVNIPLLEAIKQIPKYAKLLKEMCTNKRKLKGNSRVNMSRNVSAIIHQTDLPEKCEDLGVFTVPCTIGTTEFGSCMLDLGSSINVMPTSIYNSLSLGPLQPTGLVIQLANRSITRPKGIIEDVLVKVNDLIFPADFYILDMERETSSSKGTLILGRPFMRTARAKIDAYAGTLSMAFGNRVIRFNLFDAMKHPHEEHSVFALDLFDGLIDNECADEFINGFPSIVGFDDTFTSQDSTNIEICSVYAKINDNHVATNSTDTISTYTSTSNTITVANIDILGGSSTIPQESKVQSDLDELYAALGIDQSAEIFSCECGICNVCLEINAAILGEDILMLTTTCAEIQTNSITLEVDTKNVDFSRKQLLPIVEKLLVEPLIKPHDKQLFFTIYASLPPILSDSQAQFGFSVFHVFVIAGPPYFVLLYKFTWYLLFLVSCVRSAERPPPKPPDMDFPAATA
ncbi:unnamed protein product [Trifolium pratense]|uniref:Uncharacterized protein n=1 Tax=Trifolium pratense TaxID=57577 RepID=A0ACB0JDK0_TRIPR|nr:unnamed protein product [Trifolium pratense]